MMLRPDDDVSRLRAVWLGPEGTRWPMDWTYVEWAIASIAALPAAAVSVWAIVVFLGADWVAWMLGFVLGALVAISAGFGAKTALGPKVDPDRPVRYLLKLCWREAARLVWAHGPVDSIVIALTIATWVPAMILTPGPWGLRAPVIALAAHRLWRYLVNRFQSAERHWDRLLARAERSPVGVTYVVPVSNLED